MSSKKRSLLNRIISFVLTLSLLLTGIPILVHADDNIYSKASDWAKSEIESANKNGVLPTMLKGKDMTKFATREELCELAVLLYEKLNGKVVPVPSDNAFTDTKNEQVMKAYSLGITSGTTATTFEPNTIISREQVATMFGRAIQKLYPNMNYSELGAPNFLDKANISSWALSHVLFLSREGIIKGDDGKFMPRGITEDQKKNGYGTTKREEAIAITVRILNTDLKGGVIVTQPIKKDEIFTQTIKNDVVQTAGSLNSNGWQLKIPADTFGMDSKLNIEELSRADSLKLQASNSKILGDVIKLNVDGKENVRLGLPINLTIQIPKDQMGGLKAEDLFYGYYYNGQWEYYMPDSVDMDKGTISFDVYHFSSVAVFSLSEQKQMETYAKNMATLQWQAQNQGKEMRTALGKQYNDLFASMGIEVESDRKQLAADLASYMESAIGDTGGIAPIDALAQMANSASKGKEGMADFQNKLMEFTGKGIVSVLEQMHNASPGAYTAKFASSVNVLGNLSSSFGSVAGGDNKAALQSIGSLLQGLHPAVLFGTAALKFIADQMENTIVGWSEAELEKAYQGYIGNGTGKFGYGSGVEDDLPMVLTVLGGGARKMNLNIVKKFCEKYGMDESQLTDTGRNTIIRNAERALKIRFDKRKIDEVEIVKIQKREEIFIKAIKDRGLLDYSNYNKFFRDGKGAGKFSVGDRLEKIYKLRTLALSYVDADKRVNLRDSEVANIIAQWIYWGEKGDREGFYKYLRDLKYNEKPGLLNSEGLVVKNEVKPNPEVVVVKNNGKAGWYKLETKTNDWETMLATQNKNEYWKTNLDVKTTSVTISTKYVGAPSSWLFTGMTQEGSITWTEVTQPVLYPGDEVSVDITVKSTRRDHKNNNGTWMGLAQMFIIDDKLAPVGMASYLKDDKGTTSFVVGPGNAFETVSAKAKIKVGQGTKDGEKMTIRVSASGGIQVLTYYIYVWRAAK